MLRLVLFSLLVSPTIGFAQVSQNFLSEQQPRWELGAGLVGLTVPDYPGATNTRVRFVPFPFYIYRGDTLRSDDEGTRARLLYSERHETGLSFAFNFPVRSNDNPSRVGMPDLDTLFSFGPRMLYRFLAPNSNHRLNATLALRAAFSTKLSFANFMRSEGFTLEPQLSYWYRWQESGTTLFTNLGLLYGSSKYTGFFYNVAADQTNLTRPTYQAKAGIVDVSWGVGITQAVADDWFGFVAASWRNLDASASVDSPLLETRNNYGLVIGVIWTFYESETMVDTKKKRTLF